MNYGKPNCPDKHRGKIEYLNFLLGIESPKKAAPSATSSRRRSLRSEGDDKDENEASPKPKIAPIFNRPTPRKAVRTPLVHAPSTNQPSTSKAARTPLANGVTEAKDTVKTPLSRPVTKANPQDKPKSDRPSTSKVFPAQMVIKTESRPLPIITDTMHSKYGDKGNQALLKEVKKQPDFWRIKSLVGIQVDDLPDKCRVAFDKIVKSLSKEFEVTDDIVFTSWKSIRSKTECSRTHQKELAFMREVLNGSDGIDIKEGKKPEEPIEVADFQNEDDFVSPKSSQKAAKAHYESAQPESEPTSLEPIENMDYENTERTFLEPIENMTLSRHSSVPESSTPPSGRSFVNASLSRVCGIESCFQLCRLVKLHPSLHTQCVKTKAGFCEIKNFSSASQKAWAEIMAVMKKSYPKATSEMCLKFWRSVKLHFRTHMGGKFYKELAFLEKKVESLQHSESESNNPEPFSANASNSKIHVLPRVCGIDACLLLLKEVGKYREFYKHSLDGRSVVSELPKKAQKYWEMIVQAVREQHPDATDHLCWKFWRNIRPRARSYNGGAYLDHVQYLFKDSPGSDAPDSENGASKTNASNDFQETGVRKKREEAHFLLLKEAGKYEEFYKHNVAYDDDISTLPRNAQKCWRRSCKSSRKSIQKLPTSSAGNSGKASVISLDLTEEDFTYLMLATCFCLTTATPFR
ncbi:hypothetical protein L596_019674 [Steinernema carpocapsae]|nr:hypothetical protein L596_019674 [Steinernema carpocapsae]